MNPDHSTQWFHTFSAQFGWNRWILITPQWFLTFTAGFGWKTCILITPLSDSVCFHLELKEKKGNPGHSTQWFRIFSAWFEWETRILIAPHRDSVQIRLNEWKRRILITLLRDLMSFLLDLNAKYESWPLTQGFHNFSLIWMWNVQSDHSTQWFRIFCGCRCRASRLTGAGVYTVSPHPRSWRPCRAAR